MEESPLASMWKETTVLFKNCNFVLVMICFILIFSVYSVVGYIIDPLFLALNYTDTSVAFYSVAFVFTGSIAAVITGIYLDRTRRFLTTLRCIGIAGTVVFVAFIWIAPTKNPYLVGVTVCLAGLITVPIMAVGFTFGTETSHPVNPALVVGLMMSIAQLTLFGSNILLLILLEKQGPTIVLVVLCVFPLMTFILSFLIK